MSWVAEELRDVDLGDVRRNRRLIQIVEDLAGSPESSVPLASRDRAALQGIYDFWSNPRIATERRPNSDYLIRIHHDRPIKLKPEDTPQSLHKLLQEAPASGYLRLDLQRTPRRAACEVILEVSWMSVWLQPPVTHAQREHLAPVKVQVLRAIELDHDDDRPLVEWTLITTLPIADLAVAQQLLKWYSYRWLIERYHYTLKSGCRVEHLQLETFERLERAIATYVIVAWRLLWLTYLIRPTDEPLWDIEADWVLELVEWQALCEYYHAPVRGEDDPPGFQQCLRWIAQLGGFLGRKSDGDPGARTIWRGLRRLRDLVKARLHQRDPQVALC